MEKKNKRLILLVGILLLTIGISFAYFTGNILITGSGSNIEAMAGKYLTVEYQAGSRMTGRLEPGSTISKNFTVKITPYKDQKEATYVIKFNIDNNTFQKCTGDLVSTYHCIEDEEELIYTLKDNTGRVLKTGDITGVTGNVVIYQETKEVEEETSFNYTFEITFKETNGSQNHNKNKTINGNLNVEYGTKTDVNIMAVYIIDQEGHETRSDRIPQNTSSAYYQYNTTRSKCDKGASPRWENNELIISNLRESGTECELYFDLLNGKSINNLIATADRTSITTSAEFGIKEEDSGGLYEFDGITVGSKTQFYRGAVTNNYVRLGKDTSNYTYWRIVRFDEEGNIRLIYDGTSAHDNGEASDDRVLTTNYDGTNMITQAYHNQYNNVAYVGWTWTSNQQRPNNTTGEHPSGGTPSDMKNYLENTWLPNFKNRLSVYEKGQLTTGKYCNDRTLQNGSWNIENNMFFGAYDRLQTNKTPSFECDTRDTYTLEAGLLTVDEYAFAGGGGYQQGNGTFYLYTGRKWWTMSPSHWADKSHGLVYYIDISAYITQSDGILTNGWGVRPVITLKGDTLFNPTSNGTKDNPYTIAG